MRVRASRGGRIDWYPPTIYTVLGRRAQSVSSERPRRCAGVLSVFTPTGSCEVDFTRTRMYDHTLLTVDISI